MHVLVVGDAPDDQVWPTIGLMKEYANQDSQCPEIQQEAQYIQQQAQGDQKAMTQMVWQTTKGKIQFVRDEAAASSLEGFLSQTYYGAPVVELLIRPADMAKQEIRQGDCDDFSMYAAALLIALGIPCAFVTLAGDPTFPQNFTHVYVAAYPNGERVVIDASHGSYCGWEAPRPYARKKEWSVNGGAGDGDGSALLIAVALGVAAYFAVGAYL
jgi:hypothetical protein